MDDTAANTNTNTNATAVREESQDDGNAAGALAFRTAIHLINRGLDCDPFPILAASKGWDSRDLPLEEIT